MVRPKGETIQNQRAEYFPILPDPRSAIIDLIIELSKWTSSVSTVASLAVVQATGITKAHI